MNHTTGEFDIGTFLAETRPFSSLDEMVRAQLVDIVKVHKLSRGQQCFTVGDIAENLWAVVDGLVLILATRPGGGLLSLEVVSQGELFGISSLIRRATYTATARSTNTATVVSIPRVVAISCLMTSPDFSVSSVALLAHRVVAAHAMRLSDCGAVEQRLANTLLQLDARVGSHVHLTRKEVSEIAGTRLETAIRHLSQWRKEGILGEAPRGCIRIQDTHRLARIAELRSGSEVTMKRPEGSGPA